MNDNLDYSYQQLLTQILENGVVKKDRTGTGTISLFGTEIRHNMQSGFPLLTTKKMFMRGIAVELEWFLKGLTNIDYLLQKNVHIWDGDAHKNYERLDKAEHSAYIAKYPGRLIEWATANKQEYVDLVKERPDFATKYGNMGPIYGHQWRKQGGEFICKNGVLHNEGKKGVDQLAEAVDLLRSDPDNRRIKVDAWNAQELQYMALPPCHTDFQLYTQELSLQDRVDIYIRQHPDWIMVPEHEFLDKRFVPRRGLSLKWQQRSVDTFLGLPFNIASYGLLLKVIANQVNMVPLNLIGSLGDTHIYLNHVEQCHEQIEREPFPLPTLDLDGDATIDNFDSTMIKLNNYISHPKIEGEISN